MTESEIIQECVKLNETMQNSADAMQDALERPEHDENEDYDLSCLSENERKTFTELLLKIDKRKPEK